VTTASSMQTCALIRADRKTGGQSRTGEGPPANSCQGPRSTRCQGARRYCDPASFFERHFRLNRLLGLPAAFCQGASLVAL
jgi:hypothetical protein